MTTKPTDIQIHRFRDAGICVLVLVLAELKSEEERAESVWDKGKGLCERNDGSCSSRDVCIYIRIVFLPSHFFSVIAVHDRRHDNNSAAIGG